MADGQTFRIEIPVVVTTQADTGQLRQIEQTVQHTDAALRRLASSSSSAFSNVASGASSAASGMQQMAAASQQSQSALQNVGTSAQQAGQQGQSAAQAAASAIEGVGQATSEISNSVNQAANSFDGLGDAAEDAAQDAQNSFDGADSGVDRFTRRVEQSQRSIRQMFSEKMEMVITALDKAAPVIADITGRIKNLVSKAWNVVVKMTDLVTAPFKALKNMIMSPITMTLSIAGISMGASSFYQTFTEFTSGMSNVKALSGATDEEFQQLTATAQELGATTKFTAAQASEGMQYLAMAGWETNQIIEAMPGMLNLAAAGMTDLGTAADIVTDVMTAMGMGADQAGRAADVFARTATSTNTTIQKMGETLKYAAPIAHSFGLSLEEVSTLTGLMANSGIKASQAGTAIRSSLLAMASPSSEAQKAIDKLGLTFSDSAGNMKDMGTIVRELQGAFAGLSEKEKLAYADDIFGKYASSGWLGVINQGADAYDKLFASLQDSKGAAEEMAEIQLDNLTGDVTLLQSAVDGMKVSLMDKINPYLREGVQWVTSKIPQITSMLSGFVDAGIAKVKELKETFESVFSSRDFMNADTVGEKLAIAWDKIIAQPFSEWWEGNGRGMITGIVSRVGTTFGEVLHGVITGILAAIRGEDVNFEGMNFTGIAKAAAETAKEYVTSFTSALNVSGIWNQMPGLLKGGLLTAGGAKLGGGILGLVKDIGLLKIAFKGLTGTAAAAGTAAAGVGASAAGASAGVGGMAGALSGLGGVLAAIPGWGWAALAVLTAVGLGVKYYNDVQKQREQDLLHAGDAVEAAAERYKEAAKTATDIGQTWDAVKEIQVQISEAPANQEVIDNIKTEMGGILDKTVLLTAQMQREEVSEEVVAMQEELGLVQDRIADLKAKAKNPALTAQEVEKLNGEIRRLEDREAYLTAQIQAASEISPEVQAMKDELELVQDRIATLKAKAENPALTAQEVARIQAEINRLEGREAYLTTQIQEASEIATGVSAMNAEIQKLEGKTVELAATLEASGYDTATAETIIDQYGKVVEGTKKITLEIADKTDLTPEEIGLYVTKLSGIETKTADINIKLQGSSLKPGEIATLASELERIKTQEAEIKVKMAEGEDSMTPDEWNALVDQYGALLTREHEITLALEGAQLTEEEIQALETELTNLETQASNLLLSLGFSPNSELTKEDLENLWQQFADLGNYNAVINFALGAGSISLEDLTSYNEQLAAYAQHLEEITGGMVSAEEIMNGTVTDEQINSMKLASQAEAEAAYFDLGAEVYAGRQRIADEVAQRDRYKQELDAKTAEQTGQRDAAAAAQALGADINRAYSEYGMLREKVNAGETLDENQSAFFEGFWDNWGSSALMDKYAGTGLAEFMNLGGLNGINLENYREITDAIVAGIYKDAAVTGGEAAAAQEKYNTQNESLMKQYRAEQDFMTAGYTLGSQYQGYSLDELAAQYNTLDEAGREMFANALHGLAELNASTDYISEAEKTQVSDIQAMAIKSVETEGAKTALDGLQQALMGVSTEYAKLGNQENAEELMQAFDAEHLEAVNAALEALGLNGIESIADLSTVLQGFSDLNAEDMNFDSLANALETLTGSTEQLEEYRRKIEEVRQEMEALSQVTEQTPVVEQAATAPTPEPAVSTAVPEMPDVEEISPIAQAVQTATEALMAMSDAYNQVGDAASQNTMDSAYIENVNAALEALGQDPISNLSELSSAIEQLNGQEIDLDVEDVISSTDLLLSSMQAVNDLSLGGASGQFETLKRNASTAKSKIDETRTAISNLDGKTATVTINIQKNGSATVNIPGNAEGGIYRSGAFLSWVAEDGPEAIIPLGAKRRQRGMELWMEAGRQLGISEFAEGGIAEPYANIVSRLPDYDEGNDIGGGQAAVLTGARGGGDNVVNISMEVNPSFEIDGAGTDADGIMDIIRAKQSELAELLGGEVADRLTGIVSNMA